MKIRIVALGTRMPAWVDAAVEDYLKRLPRELAAQLVEIKPEARDRGRTVQQTLAREAERIAAATQGWRTIALDERGEPWTTARLAQRLREARDRGRNLAFVIGSADGLDPHVKRDADVIVSLSALTLAHGVARVMLAEQLYRAASMLAGHPYHRA
ncbi:MAG TPA: 23S rRNA (pseudouridine(1915)-N(3))-methyltransferase RlmH [Casimicrobiaceae bacterium]|nr:23S rRNA (pseudouridine(1915)-N(3))-methyltransferase RlmH [Casimicrobiaceae bacterium]